MSTLATFSSIAVALLLTSTFFSVLNAQPRSFSEGGARSGEPADEDRASAPPGGRLGNQQANNPPAVPSSAPDMFSESTQGQITGAPRPNLATVVPPTPAPGPIAAMLMPTTPVPSTTAATVVPTTPAPFKATTYSTESITEPAFKPQVEGPAPENSPAPAPAPQENLNQGNCYLGYSKAYDRPECFWYNCYGYCDWLGSLGKTISYRKWVYQKNYYLGFNHKRSGAFLDVCKSNCRYFDKKN